MKYQDEYIGNGRDKKMGVAATYLPDSQVTLFTLVNENQMELTVCDLGAVLYSLSVPDRFGKTRDVVLGYEDLNSYRNNDPGLGAVIGRNVNRISHAAFTQNGRTFYLDKNEGENNLHSGFDRYFERMWKAAAGGTKEEPAVSFRLHSPDGDQGFPGQADIQVTYTLTKENEVKISYRAVSDQDTIFNMTNHSYFNLRGHGSGTVEDQVLWMDADAYTPADQACIPTGEIRSVWGTPMDFRTPKRIGRDIGSDEPELQWGGGYNQNFVLNDPGYENPFAILSCEESGISMEMYTDLPGVQVYTGNYLNGENGKGGCRYEKWAGICFETQYFPDTPNKPAFPASFVKAGTAYETSTIYKFHTV